TKRAADTGRNGRHNPTIPGPRAAHAPRRRARSTCFDRATSTGDRVNLNDLLTGAWTPFAPLATQPALSNPQTLASLLTPQVQIPWASDDPTEPILFTPATQDPYAHFSDRADSGAPPGSAPTSPAVQDLYALFSDTA